MINDKKNILILTLDHYKSVEAQVDYLKGAILYCASHDLYLELKKLLKKITKNLNILLSQSFQFI